MIRNQKGQVAIFIALIFQVLFLFFAMVINVGMLVHQKINLQNSVDLAAYYGAMKQAESLNAIAHVNYQIRQSWKLLAWRYRVIGMGGDMDNCHPYSKSTRDLDRATEEGSFACNGLDDATMADTYKEAGFCSTYIPFKPMPPGENTCRDLKNYQATPTLGIPPAVGIVNVSGPIRTAIIQALENIKRRCEFVGPYNWSLLARFKVAYIRDQATRRKMINLVAGGLSGIGTSDPTADFRELNGDLASVGIGKTFQNNLTPANLESLETAGNGMNIYNGLGDPSCRGTGVNEDRPPAWLNEVNILPAFATVLTDCSKVQATGIEAGNIKFVPAALEDVENKSAPANIVNAYNLLQTYLQNSALGLQQEFNSMKGLVGNFPAPFNASLGYEKNPWCNSYVGVKAVTSPKIPFLPLSNIKLEARAFAKPFGGRIGPWSFKKWNPGDNKSSGGVNDRTDALAPQRVDNVNNVSQDALKDKTRIPNYSRFPGDTRGLVSRGVLGYYTQALFESDQQWRSGSLGNGKGPLIVDASNANDTTPDFNHWINIAKDFATENKSGDTLAYQANVPKPGIGAMRTLEISAIAPDIFDLTYYSIEPNFYENYFEKIQAHVKKMGRNIFVLSDLGSRLDDNTLKKFSVKDQIEKQKELSVGGTTMAKNLALDLTNILTYTVLEPTHVLTGWVPNKDNLEDYSLDQSQFGKCSPSDEPDLTTPIPGNCIHGGRVGFSVKIVNGEFLRGPSLKLGGDGVSGGPLMNPPPNGW